MMVPDCINFFDLCIDMHKLKQTQYRWKFTAVHISVYFQFGCKTTQHAYCSDRVVEIIEKPKLEYTTPIGQLTGLEPVTTIVRWYADADPSHPDRPNI